MFEAGAVARAIEANEEGEIALDQNSVSWNQVFNCQGSGGWWVTNPVMKTIVSYFFDTMASTVSATLRADSCVSAVAWNISSPRLSTFSLKRRSSS